MIIKLADFGGDFANLPALEAVTSIESGPMLLLKLPQFGVNVEGAAEIGLPLFMAILRQVTEAIKKLLRLFQ